MPTSRLEAFSDGVFAIAITLLVLEIEVPELEPGHSLAREVLDLWPSFAAYVTSFAVIGIIWINHHAVVGHVRYADRGLLALNLLLLLFVALIPWPTSLIAEYLRSGGEAERTAAVVYALCMAAMGLSFGAIWRYVARRPALLGSALSAEDVARRTRRFTFGGPIYVVAVLLALVSAPACLAVNALLAIYYALPALGGMRAPGEPPGDLAA
jgi:uncharacterized membrane protein